MEKFKVILGSFKKIFHISPVMSMEDLHSDIKFSFSKCPIFKVNEEFRLQVFDDDFDEFVDLDDISQLHLVIDRRIQLVFETNNLNATYTSDSTDTSNINNSNIVPIDAEVSDEGDDNDKENVKVVASDTRLMYF